MDIAKLPQLPKPINIWPHGPNVPKKLKDNYLIWGQEIHNSLDGTWEENIKKILNWSLTSPSAHNKQGWLIALDQLNKEFKILPKIDDIGTPSDPEGRETYLSLGCFLGICLEIFNAYGVEKEVRIVPYKDHYFKIVVSATFDKAKLEHPYIFDLLVARRSYRGKFKSNNISLRLRKHLQTELTNLETIGVRVRVISDKLSKHVLAELQGVADRWVLFNKDLRQETAKYLVANDTKEHRVMPGNTFGLSDESSKKINTALAKDGAFDGDFAAGFANSDRDSLASAQDLVVLTVEKDKPENWIKAGVGMVRLWLLAQSLGMGVGVSQAMVESKVHKTILRSRISEFSRVPVAVMRWGVPEEDTWPKSPRITLDDALCDD